jgi:hypothetical protein
MLESDRSAIDKLSVTASTIEEAIDRITTGPAALTTSQAQHSELANKITEDDCGVAGHDRIIAQRADPPKTGYRQPPSFLLPGARRKISATN